MGLLILPTNPEDGAGAKLTGSTIALGTPRYMKGQIETSNLKEQGFGKDRYWMWRSI